MVEVRPDREQLARLVNAHIGAVVPGWTVPTSTLLAQLEREPQEYVVDPWVTERATFVAIERDRRRRPSGRLETHRCPGSPSSGSWAR